MTTKYPTVGMDTYMILRLHCGFPNLNCSLFKGQIKYISCFLAFLTYCFFIPVFMILEGKKGEGLR